MYIKTIYAIKGLRLQQPFKNQEEHPSVLFSASYQVIAWLFVLFDLLQMSKAKLKDLFLLVVFSEGQSDKTSQNQST